MKTKRRSWVFRLSSNLSQVLLVSERKKFVFVHVFKTGGTSVKRALRRFAMPGWQEVANFVLKRIGISQFGPEGYPDHMQAQQLIDLIGLERFKSYYSFAFVRNPWDWEVSHYNYILRSKSHPLHADVTAMKSFSEYVRWRCDGNFQTQSDLLNHRKELVVDFVGRFENLVPDFQFVCQKIGVQARLPRLNVTHRPVYQSYYDDQTAELLRRAYIADIRLFGYRFEQLKRAA